MSRKRIVAGKKITTNLKKGRLDKKAALTQKLRQLFLRFKKKLPKYKKRKSQFKKGLLLLLFGILIISSSVILPKFSKVKISPIAQKTTQSKTEIKENTISDKEPIKISKDLAKNIGTLGEEVPARIIIPQLNIDIAVKESQVVNGYWELSEDTASFGLGSSFPGDNGNSVIFAHARNNLFGPLKKVSLKNKIYILSARHYFIYEVSEIKVVYPNQVEVVGPTKDERLTLFTCSGFFDNQRLIVIAKRISS